MWKMGVLKVEIVLLLNLFLVSGDVVNNDVSEHSLELSQSLNLARQKLIQETCRSFPPKNGLNELPQSQLEHILIDDEHKFLYCYVPKVACTNWKRILMILTGKWNNTARLSSIPSNIPHTRGMFRDMSSVSPAERDDMLENYHKMIIVRNPFERMLSAYRNKLEGDKAPKYFLNRVGKRIIKAYRENPSNESLMLGHDVTFKEFALFLTDPSDEMADIKNNEHWQPMTNLCHPCLIKYNLIGKIETLADDALLALHTINATHIQFPRQHIGAGTTEKLQTYFSQLDRPLISNLYKLYKNDSRMFNYHLDNIVDFDLEED